MCSSFIVGNWRSALLGEGPLDQPGDDREVAPFIVGGQDDRVLVLSSSHFVIERVRYFGVQELSPGQVRSRKREKKRVGSEWLTACSFMEGSPDAPTRQIRSPPPWAESDSLSRPTSFPDFLINLFSLLVCHCLILQSGTWRPRLCISAMHPDVSSLLSGMFLSIFRSQG